MHIIEQNIKLASYTFYPPSVSSYFIIFLCVLNPNPETTHIKLALQIGKLLVPKTLGVPTIKLQAPYINSSIQRGAPNVIAIPHLGGVLLSIFNTVVRTQRSCFNAALNKSLSWTGLEEYIYFPDPHQRVEAGCSSSRDDAESS